MKLSSIALMLFGFALNGVFSIELYSSRYDSIDIDGILASDRLVNNYVECLLNRRPCPPEGKALKRVLPEALKSKCQRCSVKQKESALKVIRRLHDAYPEKWLELAARYDPTGDYRRSYDEYLRNEQFNSIDGIGSVNERPEKDFKPVLPEVGVRFNFEEPQEPANNNENKSGENSNGNANGGNEERPAPPVRSVPSGSNQDADRTTSANNVPSTVATKPSTFNTEQTITTTTRRTQGTPMTRYTTSRPNGVFSTHFQGSFHSGPISSHVLGLVNNLGNKVARTAEIFAGMLKDTVHVIVG